jgi:hypothetical protein
MYHVAVVAILVYFFRYSWSAAAVPAPPTNPKPLETAHGLHLLENDTSPDSFVFSKKPLIETTKSVNSSDLSFQKSLIHGFSATA